MTDGVAPNQVTNIVVVALLEGISTNYADLTSGDWTTHSSENTSVLEYEVVTYDPTISYEDLKERIETASAQDELAENIRYYAEVFNVDGLSTADVGPATVTNAGSDHNNGGGGSDTDSGLSEGAVIGIAVGAVLLAILVTIILACLFQTCRAKQQTSEEPLQVQERRVPNRT